MLNVIARGETRFVGLAQKVAYRIELGFAVVDDGERSFRIQEQVFEQILRNVRKSDLESANDDVRGVLDRHPTIFTLFENADEARASLDEKEI